jgi:hypothetical protein
LFGAFEIGAKPKVLAFLTLASWKFQKQQEKWFFYSL